MKLSKKQRKAINVYIRTMAEEMGLRDWTFYVQFMVEEEDLREVDSHDGDTSVWGAACDPTPGRKHATIMLGREVLMRLIHEGPHEFRTTVCHELLHCHFASLWEILRKDLYDAGVMSQQTYNMFISNAERYMEFAIDGTAESWATSLPLLDWKVTKW